MGKISDFLKELKEGIKNLPSELEKPHNKLRIFTIASYVIILGSWAIFRYKLSILLALLIIVLTAKVFLALYYAKKK